mmetsp:Transcript_50231/g.120938  ORF Transcript_50231/g.120938 Transcript_50231/m.120938 type:complete len:250 (+) Transcript_50231:533-1282(+)
MALSFPRSASIAVSISPRSCSVCLCFSSRDCCIICASSFCLKMASSLARNSSMLFWSRCSNSRSARTLEMTSRRSSSAEPYGVGPCRRSEPRPLDSRRSWRSSSAARTSLSTTPSSSCRCEIRRCADALLFSTRRLSSRSPSSWPRDSRSCDSNSRRRESCASSCRRSSRTSRLRRRSSPPASRRATASSTAASWPRLRPAACAPRLPAAESNPMFARTPSRLPIVPKSDSAGPGRPPSTSVAAVSAVL